MRDPGFKEVWEVLEHGSTGAQQHAKSGISRQSVVGEAGTRQPHSMVACTAYKCMIYYGTSD